MEEIGSGSNINRVPVIPSSRTIDNIGNISNSIDHLEVVLTTDSSGKHDIKFNASGTTLSLYEQIKNIIQSRL